jgi:mycothiol synthase
MVPPALPISVEKLSQRDAVVIGKTVLEKAGALDPRNTLSDHKRIQLQQAARDRMASSEDFTGFAVLADREHVTPLGAHENRESVGDGEKGGFGTFWDGRLILAYAHLSRHEGSWGLEALVNPGVVVLQGAAVPQVFHALFEAAIAQVACCGGGRLQIWLRSPREAQARAAAELGFSPGRTLLEMRLPLQQGISSPLQETISFDQAYPSGRSSTVPKAEGHLVSAHLATRKFCVGADEEAWLEVNNAAFSGHPEQGNWDSQMLAAHEEEPWFDPEGFRILEIDGKMAGFCWTKIHQELDPPTGEIYAIAVNPTHQGRGLGRILLHAGLEYLRARGIQMAMLFVEESNSEAVSLYGSIGFHISWREQAMEKDVPRARS